MQSKVVKEIFDWIKCIVIAGIIAFLIHTFLFAIVIVDGASMETTLYDSERLILNKLSYNIGDIERGDIIVFHATQKDDYIKRAIGLPGEKIEYKNNQLFINDDLIDETYLGEVYTNDFGPIIIPQDYVFAMGDNRTNSTDSRIIGPISVEQITGEVNCLIWPINKFGKIN